MREKGKKFQSVWLGGSTAIHSTNLFALFAVLKASKVEETGTSEKVAKV